MALVGIICEYNPFHLGHETQLRQIRAKLGADTAIVCLMSGNFVQRGEPAILGKLPRAAAAVECGANLVLELPLTGVLRSAEGFARCGVEILDALGADYLAFGCESGDAAGLCALAERMEQPDYAAALQAALHSGQSYPAARESAARALGLNAALLQKPNDILALEYCRALLLRRMRPLIFHRAGDYHATAPDPENPSATAVRALLRAGGNWEAFVPQGVPERYRACAAAPCRACAAPAPGPCRTAETETDPKMALFSLASGERAMLARLRLLKKEDWQAAAHGAEGLWSLAWRAAQTAPSLQALENAVKSKRYPMTRIRRLLLCAALGLTEADLPRPIPYVRALAMDEVGRKVLKTMRKLETIPLINAGQTPENMEYFELERRAAGLYGLFCTEGAFLPPAQLQAERIYLKKSGF